MRILGEGKQFNDVYSPKEHSGRLLNAGIERIESMLRSKLSVRSKSIVMRQRSKLRFWKRSISTIPATNSPSSKCIRGLITAITFALCLNAAVRPCLTCWRRIATRVSFCSTFNKLRHNCYARWNVKCQKLSRQFCTSGWRWSTRIWNPKTFCSPRRKFDSAALTGGGCPARRRCEWLTWAAPLSSAATTQLSSPLVIIARRKFSSASAGPSPLTCGASDAFWWNFDPATRCFRRTTITSTSNSWNTPWVRCLLEWLASRKSCQSLTPKWL